MTTTLTYPERAARANRLLERAPYVITLAQRGVTNGKVPALSAAVQKPIIKRSGKRPGSSVWVDE
jgi:hypothetical protein